ncbi:50S ribosomal protein L9 [Mycoplasmopsis agassizii]|uniref:Large ribosomal subunit protein bL9 n=1 Tax=Mycoplasmopsis agassizii TaxID=33922 RepID=A0A269TIR8_9BACT|nr:50S ribosomal protein L9 [Mycoplasmopsis agassizii]PAK21287.1 50S ribosomal protein L9 [Mycoplasmopsis agassizii]
MKVILTKDHKDLGKAKSIVEVSPGYAQNFLFKNKLAVPYTKENQRKLEQQLIKEIEDHKQKVLDSQKLKAELEKVELVYKLKVAHVETGETHHSITAKQIMKSLADHGFHLEKHTFEKVFLKTVGPHYVQAKLFGDVEARLEVVIKEDDGK